MLSLGSFELIESVVEYGAVGVLLLEMLLGSLVRWLTVLLLGSLVAHLLGGGVSGVVALRVGALLIAGLLLGGRVAVVGGLGGGVAVGVGALLVAGLLLGGRVAVVRGLAAAAAAPKVLSGLSGGEKSDDESSFHGFNFISIISLRNYDA